MNEPIDVVQLDKPGFKKTVTELKKWPGGISDGLTLPCGICGVIPRFDYKVSENIWEAVAPSEHRLGVICFPCLDNLATEKRIDVSLHLENIQFTGKGKTIMLKPIEVYHWRKKL